jgi:hypothetical protein
MKRLKGPELKPGKPEVPDFLVNFYYDLRDRRLLPLVALTLVAIFAVPFLLGNDSEETPEPPPDSGPIAALKEAAAAGSSKLTVVEATPGLRDYSKRLRARTPTDPFKQRYTAPVLKDAKLNEAKSTSTTGTAGGEDTTSTSTTTGETALPPSSDTGGAPAGTGGGSAGGGGGSSSQPQPNPEAVVYSFAVDVTIVHSSGSEAAGDKQTDEPDVRKRILPPTSLPGRQTEVVTYLGLSPTTRKPFFLVSTDVTGVFGEGKCAAGSDRCQLIELELGMPEVFEYGEAGDRYKITATHVQYVATGHS